MPAEIRHRIIEHLLPNVADEAMQICPCLAKAPTRAKKSCSCFKNGISWDDAYRRPPANVALLHRPTLLVNRLLHADTVHVLSKLPNTIHFCSGPCLLAFWRCTPFKHRKLINAGLLKFNVHQFWKDESSTGNYKELKLLYRDEMETGFAKQMGYMLRARLLWGMKIDPGWDPRPCLSVSEDDHDNLQYREMKLKLDGGKHSWTFWGHRKFLAYLKVYQRDLEMSRGFKDWRHHGCYEPILLNNFASTRRS